MKRSLDSLRQDILHDRTPSGHTPSFPRTRWMVMTISGLQTWALPGQALIHFYIDTFVGPATSTPHQPTGPRPATSTPYRPATLTPCILTLIPLLDRPRQHHTNPPDLDRPRRHHTDRPRRHHTDRPRQHHTNRWRSIVDVTCSLRDSLRHFPHAWRFPTRVHLCAVHLRKPDRAIDRRHPYNGSMTST